jgi:hypothetical protein
VETLEDTEELVRVPLIEADPLSRTTHTTWFGAVEGCAAISMRATSRGRVYFTAFASRL